MVLIFISASLIAEIELTRKLTLVLELLCWWSCNSTEALCQIVPQVHLDMLHLPFWMECHLWKGGNRIFLYQNGACTSWYESISLGISSYMSVGASLYCLYHWDILVYDCIRFYLDHFILLFNILPRITKSYVSLSESFYWYLFPWFFFSPQYDIGAAGI